MTRKSTTLAAILLVLAIAIPSHAGVVVVNKDTFKAGTDAEKPGTTTAYIGSDRLRVETAGGVQEAVFIFRQDKQVMWIVDPAQKKYMEVTRQTLEQSRKQIEAATAQMESQLENLPPEQAAQLRKMMEAKGLTGERKTPSFRKSESGVKIGKWTTDKYVGESGGMQKVIFTAPPEKLGFKKSDLKVFEGFNEFVSILGAGQLDPFPTGTADQKKLLGFEGMPVKTVDVDTATGQMDVTEVQSVTRKDLDAALFEVPQGYQKHESMPQR